MKKILLLLLIAVSTAGMALAVNADDVRIYINPGHGGWGPNDRPMATIPYPFLSSTGRPDTCGFYESNTNLWKGLEMRRALIRMGAQPENITMSRTQNGPYPYDGNTYGYTYSKYPSVIAAEAEEGNYDMFVSIHSNASDNLKTNYPLYIYRGTTDTEAVSGSRAMCETSWPQHWMNDLDPVSHYSPTNTCITGDVTLYGDGDNTTNNASGITYYGYLGALKHSVPGFLVEGWFHTYQPARHRALNEDYCRQEGIRLARGAADYFGISGENTGYIMGSVKDAVNSLENSLYTYRDGSVDAHAPINGATVKLYRAGTLVATYTTDDNYNGIFVFNGLEPGGNYTINVTADGYESLTNQGSYTVTANETTYMVLSLEPVASTMAKGIFAYDLNRSTDDSGNYVFSFKCNTDATEAYLVFTDSVSGEETGRVTLSNVVEGDNSVSINPDDLPGGDGQVLAWAVNVVGEAITTIQRVNDVNATYTRAAMVIDRSPESAHFGTIYVGERVGSNNAGNGLYVCDVNAKPINSTPYRGGQTLSNCMRLGIDNEGKVYIPDWADASSGIYVADPDNLNGSFTPFFEGNRASNGLITNDGGEGVGSSVPSVWVHGSGADTKLFAFLEDLAGPSGNKNGIGVYNIGQGDGSLASTWNQAPSSYLDIGALEASTNGNIITDPMGRGVWVAQNRAKDQNTAAVPALVFTDYSGNVLFNSGIDLTTLNGSAYAGFAINNANNLLVINDAEGVLQFYDISWNGNTPALTHHGTTYIADARTSNNYIPQMAFDWGGNLVCAGKNVGIYSIPTDDNQSTTPARAALCVVKKELAVDTSTVKGIFAYDLASSEDNDGYTFSFKSNSDAVEAYLVFTDNTTADEVGRVALSNIVEGENSVTLTKEQLPGNNGQVMNWAVNVVGQPITRITRLNDHYANYTRAAVAIDRSPESAHFGTIYVGERVSSGNAGNGLYACDINGQPTHANVYNGGLTWANNMRLAVDGEGKIYIPEWGDATSGIYVADPDNLGGQFNQFFVGTRDSKGLITNNGESVGSSVPGVWIQGTGADTKLYAFLEDVIGPTSGKGNNVGIYNIGLSDGSLLDTWDKAPDQLLDVGAYMINGNGNIIADAGGRGTWVMQYRSKGLNSPGVPSLLFVGNDGNIVYNGGSLSSLNGSLMSGFAINNENNMMVINDGDGVLQFFDITWNEEVPTLTHNGTSFVADARSGVNAIYQMAFDWGGNLVCAGGNIGIYSMPTDDNQSTTPARAALTVTKGEAFKKGDVNYDGEVDVADVSIMIRYVLGYNPQPFNKAAAYINDDQDIDVADVAILINMILNTSN